MDVSLPWIFATKQLYSPVSFTIKLLTVSSDIVVMDTVDVVVMVYFDPSMIPVPLNSQTMVGIGSAVTLHENDADWPRGT